ncbi:hypothetical protein DRF59_18220 [Chryseobacterium flavum]|uniref:Uncharacterized protein n=1 Tax=Chryseobacterium flavum TaxID=415851 RepID=A0A3D9CGX9_9FLAO|nr:hypothetical protein [Chryseobacterium flavum]REC65028.1 hypothetical protein DRF59_18220 [Chryseobacterium flavum]
MKSWIKNIIILCGLLITTYALACDACKLQQPEVTRNFTHGTGPESNWDWFIVGIVILITVLAFILSAKYLIKPGEKNKTHIKYSVFSSEN